MPLPAEKGREEPVLTRLKRKFAGELGARSGPGARLPACATHVPCSVLHRPASCWAAQARWPDLLGQMCGAGVRPLRIACKILREGNEALVRSHARQRPDAAAPPRAGPEL